MNESSLASTQRTHLAVIDEVLQGELMKLRCGFVIKVRRYGRLYLILMLNHSLCLSTLDADLLNDLVCSKALE